MSPIAVGEIEELLVAPVRMGGRGPLTGGNRAP